MADEDEYDEVEDDADEWQAEAEKWKELAAKHQRRAAENAGAVERLAALEKASSTRDDEYAERLKAAKAEGEEAAEAAKAEGAKSAEDWRAEAARWKEAARKFEDTAKKNFAAAARAEKLEAEQAEAGKKAAKDKADADAKTAESRAEIEAKATQAELKAMRLEVAKELNIPPNLVDLLSGRNKREIEQSAGELLRQIANHKQPEPEAVKAAEEAKKREAEAQEDSELAKSREQLTEAEVKVARLEVAIEKQLPSGLADFLTARNREDLQRQADALLAAIGGAKPETSTRARMPVSRLRSGALPEGANEPEPDTSAIAESIMRRSRGY